MAHFLSGPPGGRTLPHTPTKLSDLAGGVYGYGASMASTGPNANRAVIKASLAQRMGETWEDVLEYWQVDFIIPVIVHWFTVHHSSTQIEETSNLAIVWARSTIMVVSTLRLEE